LLLYKALCLLEQFPYNIEGVSLSADISSDLSLVISKLGADKVFYLFDENTERCCQAHLNMDKDALEPFTLVLKSGEENKNLDQVRKVWDFFEGMGKCMAKIKCSPIRFLFRINLHNTLFDLN